MKTLVRCLGLCLSLAFASCGTVHHWLDLRTDPMTLGECYDGLVYVTEHDGLVVDSSVSDRGLGILQTRWRQRLRDTHPARFRLRAEVLVEKGSTKDGWPVQFVVEQQWVKDLRRSLDPKEEDWSTIEQDQEREALLAEKFVRRLAPRSMPMAPRNPNRTSRP